MDEGRDFRRGDVFAGFRLRSRLGRGASGEVWEAEELALGNRLVALKLLRPELAQDPRSMERFRRGAVAASRIHHPGVVAVYSYGIADGQPYLAQELIEGGVTLGGLIASQREEGRMDAAWFRRVAELVAEIAEALACGHAAGVLHRDVKPENILVDRAGRAKVVDFGLARLDDEQPLSASGDVMGTLCYMSPTQVSGDVHHLDESTDVFSLGATFYELLTLKRAFKGTNLEEIAHEILHIEPPPARALQPRVPAHLELVAIKALEKRVADRIPGMVALAEELRLFLDGQPTRLRQSTVFTRALKWGRRHPTTSVGALVAIVGLLALFGVARWLLARGGQAAVENEHSRALYFLQLGNLDAAREAIRRADEIDDDDPRGHLILAAGLAGRGQRPEMERELALARSRGFAHEPGELDGALEHACFALALVAERDFASYPEAEAHIDRALALDPDLHSLELTRYHIRLAANDPVGAEQALARYQERVVPASETYALLTALRQEVRGELEAALATLEELRSRFSSAPAGLSELRWHRNAGRIAVNLGRLAQAEEWLERAVLDDPEDCLSWEGLAAVGLKRILAGDARESVRAEARAHAERASECSPSLENPFLVRATIAIRELEVADVSVDPRARPEWSEARAALDALAALPRPSAQAPGLEASLYLAEARPAMLRHDYRSAARPYEAALRVDPANARVSRQQVQCLWHLARFAEGVAVAQAAIERLEREVGSAQGEGTLLAWGLGNAGKANDATAFAFFRARLLDELSAPGGLAPVDALNTAEFLADVAPELQDCEAALELLDAYDYERELGSDPAVRAAIEKVLKRCP